MIANKTTPWTLHDTNENAAYTCGFVANVDGSFSGRLRDDLADRTFVVKAGAFYAGDIKLAKTTGAVGVTALLLYHCRPSVGK